MSILRPRTGNRRVEIFYLISLVGLVFAVHMALGGVAYAAEGNIVRIIPEKTRYKAGETIRVWVEVESYQSGQRHHLVVLNILDKNERAIYDSHEVDEDIDFVIKRNERKRVGPFRFQWPLNTRRGTYSLLVGYRAYPWEPLLEFQGASWCPPVATVSVR